MASRLINRNVVAGHGRSSMRLEPELWDALYEICRRQQTPVGEIVRQAELKYQNGSRTSAVRVFVLQYYRDAATERGHAAASHGSCNPIAVVELSECDA